MDTRQTKLVYVFPTDFKGNITTINADETLLSGVWSTDAEKNKFEPNVHFSPDGKWVIFRANFEGRMKFML